MYSANISRYKTYLYVVRFRYSTMQYKWKQTIHLSDMVYEDATLHNKII